jgi:type I restriction enzyme S subunit
MKLTARTLGEICDEVGGVIRTGPFGSQLHQSDYLDVGIPVVMPKDIVGEKLSEKSIARIGSEEVARLSQHILKEGDIVYGRRGDIGRQALITKKEAGWLCGTGCLRISLGTTVIDSMFLHYYLMQEDVIEWIYKQAVGATMPNLNTSILRSVPIEYPPLETQRKIASTLSAYDDLIENNTRRIKILEEMARMIYREWLVNFRFPGHEQVKMVDSSLGMIPDGWEVKTLGDVCSVIKRGVSPKYDESSESTVINQKCIRYFRLSLKDSRKHNSKVPTEKYIIQGDVLINSTGVGTLGRVAQVLQDVKDCTVDSHVTIVRPSKSVNADFLGLLLFELQEHFESLGQGATGQTELGREAIANTNVIVADMDIQEKLSATVKPMRRLAKRLAEKNENLRQTRDLLLPKLISGEVAV